MKKLVILLTALFVLLALPAAWLNLQQGIYWGDLFLRRTDSGFGPIQMTTASDGVHFSGVLNNFGWHGTVTQEGDSVRVSFPDVTGIVGTWNGEYLCDLSGMPYAFSNDMITIVVNGESQPPSRIAQADLMCRMAMEQTEQRGNLFLLFFGFLAYGLGMLSILVPDKMHFLGGRWRYAELSDAGRAVQKASGWLCIAMSIGIMYLPLFLFLLD